MLRCLRKRVLRWRIKRLDRRVAILLARSEYLRAVREAL